MKHKLVVGIVVSVVLGILAYIFRNKLISIVAGTGVLKSGPITFTSVIKSATEIVISGTADTTGVAKSLCLVFGDQVEGKHVSNYFTAQTGKIPFSLTLPFDPSKPSELWAAAVDADSEEAAIAGYLAGRPVRLVY